MTSAKVFGFSLFMILSLVFSLGAETVTVVTQKDGKTTTKKMERTEETIGANTVILFKDGQDTTRLTLAPNGEVLLYEVNQGSAKIVIKNTGGELDLEINKDNRQTKSRMLKRGPFFGVDFTAAVLQFVRNPDRAFEFWIVPGPHYDEQRQLVLTKEGESLFGGKKLIKAKLGLTGIASMFWSAQVWIEPNGRMAKFVGNRGPGTPDEIIEVFH